MVDHLEKIIQAAAEEGWVFHGASNTIHVGLLFQKNGNFGSLIVARHDLGFFIVNENHGILNREEWLNSKWNSKYYESIPEAVAGLLSLITEKDTSFVDHQKERLPELRASTLTDWPKLAGLLSRVGSGEVT